MVIRSSSHQTLTVYSLNETSHKTQTFTRGPAGDSRRFDRQDLVHPDLLIGHPVDDAVVARVHVPQVVSDDDDSECQNDHEPQHDVEDHGVIEVVIVSQVVKAAWVTLKNVCSSQEI